MNATPALTALLATATTLHAQLPTLPPLPTRTIALSDQPAPGLPTHQLTSIRSSTLNNQGDVAFGALLTPTTPTNPTDPTQP